MKPSIRDRAYAVVKKLKMAYSKEGCDLQIELEKEYAPMESTTAKVLDEANMTKRTLAKWDE